MPSSQPPIERPVLWSHFMEAAQHRRDRFGHDEVGSETTCVITAHSRVEVRKMRNWLNEEFDSSFEMIGLFLENEKHLFAVRFVFKDFEAKVLFALRWL